MSTDTDTSADELTLEEACEILQASTNPLARKIGDGIAQSFNEEANS